MISNITMLRLIWIYFLLKLGDNVYYNIIVKDNWRFIIKKKLNVYKEFCLISPRSQCHSQSCRKLLPGWHKLVDQHGWNLQLSWYQWSQLPVKPYCPANKCNVMQSRFWTRLQRPHFQTSIWIQKFAICKFLQTWRPKLQNCSRFSHNMWRRVF